MSIEGRFLSGTCMVTRQDIINAIQTVQDPELFLDIWFLGLIYRIDLKDDGGVEIDMTFTSPMCPAGPQLVQEVREKVQAVVGADKTVAVKVVFSPPWQPSEDVRAMLGLN